MSYLVDSDAVADWLNRQPAAVSLLSRLLPDGLAISIVTHSEIMEGILGGRDPRAAEQVFRAFLRGVRVLPITRAVSVRHAELRLDLRRNKRPVRERALDLLIAATALTHRLTLVTSNTRDYADIANLQLLNPRTGT